MINVCQVVSDTNIGGAGRYLLNYVKSFDRENFSVTVLIPENSMLKEKLSVFSDITVKEIPYMADKSFDRRAVSEIKKVFKEIKPQIVHTHASLSARIAAKLSGVKTVIATRHCIEPAEKFPVSFIKSILNNTLCDVYIAVSEAVGDNLLHCGIKKEKIKQIDNGVEKIQELTAEEKLKIKEKYGLKSEFVFGIFARLEDVKGHKYFIDAAKKYLGDGLSARFLIVGDGNLKDALKEQAKDNPEIIFTGYVNDTKELLNITDVNVLASESEAMSLAILEAMSLGKPTIATNVGGNPQIVENGKNGLLTEYSDSEGLKNAFIKFFADKEFYNRCSENAKEIYNQKYTAEVMVKKLEKLYREVSE